MCLSVVSRWVIVTWTVVHLITPLQTIAQIAYTWKGGSGNWSSPENWTPPGVPGPEDVATVASGTVLVNSAAIVGTLNFSGGSFQGDGVPVLTVVHGGSWSGGTISNMRLSLSPACVFSLDGAAKTLVGGVITNAGTLAWTSGQLNLENNATFHNLLGALTDVQSDVQVLQSGAGTSTFRNEGTYQKSAGLGTNSIQIVSVINHGVLQASRGTIRIEASSLAATGVGNQFHAEADAGVVVTRSISANSFDGTSFSGPGVKAIATSGGNVTFARTIVGTNLQLVAGDYLGAAEFQGAIDWIGGSMSAKITIPNGSTLNLRGTSPKSLMTGAITNNGSVIWTGGQFNLENNATFHNSPGALVDVQSDVQVLQTGGGTSTFRNEGTYRKSSGTGTNTIQIVSFQQAGVLEIDRGFILVAGNLAPTPQSRLRLGIGGAIPGAEFGQLQVSGNLELSGALDVSLAEGFSPVEGQSFQVVSSRTRSGVFGVVMGSAIGGGLFLNPVYSGTGVRLTVVDATPTFSNPTWSAGEFHATLHGVAGGNYRVNASTNLVDWQPLETKVIPGSGVAEFDDASSSLIPARFYRAAFLP
ncbi:MAG TPA: hypothetical protein PLX89_18720 [Verrucomicrobiota bacterium]|nr:hypothetical protein [Verrucomicrobiales bacterium]HRI15033.1 hypothetical protein [Verrucomicrobiota bacterium]